MEADIQFLNKADNGVVPFVVTGECVGRRSMAQKALVLLFSPSIGGLDPKGLFSSVDPSGLVALAASSVSEYLDAVYGGVSLTATVAYGDRGSYSISLLLEYQGESEPLVITV